MIGPEDCDASSGDDGSAGDGDGGDREGRSDRRERPVRTPEPQRDRGLSPVVGKAMEAGLVVLYLSVVVAVLYGGAIPEYRAAAGDELGERVLAEAAVELQTALPEDPGTAARVRHRLPRTIAGTTYRIEAGNDSLVLVHPDDAVEGELPLALPEDVDEFEGAWHSSDPAVVEVEPTPAGRVVRLGRVDS